MSLQRDENSTCADTHAVEAVRSAVQNWAMWRDAGDWERFATVWHRDGHMSATWFQGSAEEFIAVTKAGFDGGVRILHFLGGTTVDVQGSRAIAQTRMMISQRSVVHDEPCDVECTGRFYDFFLQEEDNWKMVRRQPIYEKDRLDPVRPDAQISLDQNRLALWPEGYRHLAYLQEEAGFTVKDDLPGLTGAAVQDLYREGEAWLAGAEGPWSRL